MNTNQTITKRIRPSRAQKKLLDYIANFIEENGYSPSYREVKTGLNYASTASVAIHVRNLIQRGQLVKRGTSPRSLELAYPIEPAKLKSNEVTPSQEKWLVEKVEHAFTQVENEASKLTETSIDHLYVLIGALKILGMEGAAQSFMPRLSKLKFRISV